MRSWTLVLGALCLLAFTPAGALAHEGPAGASAPGAGAALRRRRRGAAAVEAVAA